MTKQMTSFSKPRNNRWGVSRQRLSWPLAAQRLPRSLRAFRDRCGCSTFRTMESHMKTLALTALLTLAIGAYTPLRAQGPYDNRADAHKDIQAALAQAQADGKLVLLDFGANWCLDCIVLSHLYEDQTVHPFLDANFHLVNIDVGNWDRNLDVSQRYGSPIDGGIPALVILAGSGEVVASTKNGALADARTATAREVLDYLKGWAARKPTHAAH